MYNDNLAWVQEDREEHDVPWDWRAWESTKLSQARREVDENRRALRREVLLLSVFTLATLAVLAAAWQSVI